MTLKILRNYWGKYKPKKWLFQSQDKEKHITTRWIRGTYEEQIYSVTGMYMRHSRIYSQNGVISDTVGNKRVRRHAKILNLDIRRGLAWT